jgi:HlyD family secretion protein
MRPRTWWVAGAGAVALAALLAWAFAPAPVQVELAQASMGAFETSIEEDGRTRLRERYVVSAPLAGRLSRIALREGDQVAAGDVLALLAPMLSPMIDERSARELQARVGATQAGVRRARTRIEAAKVALERARMELRRAEQLAQQGFLAPIKADNDRLSEQAMRMELDSAVADEHIAQHELAQARAALLTAQGGTGGAASQSFALRAPLAAKVLRIHHSSEASVPLGAPLLELGDTAALEVVAELLTADALMAIPGVEVRIERWGGPGVLQGRVRRVEPAAFTKVSALGVEEQRVNVLIDLLGAPAQWAGLGDGYRVSVRIVTRSEARVLLVPVSAVFPLPGGAAASASASGIPPAQQAPADSGVFVSDRGRARLVAVTLAARNGKDAWIRSGLQEGAKVIVYPPPEVRDGTRVKERVLQ